MRRVLAGLLFILALCTVGDSASGTYRLDWLCIDSGGLTEQSSDNYGARLTIAQTVAGYCESGNYRAYLGFWQPLLGGTVDVEEVETRALPTTFSLQQNYPNPFNPSTTIEFAIPRSGRVRLDIYNTLGRFVTRLVDKQLQAGVYRASWDGRDLSGNLVSSGVFLYRLQAGGLVLSKKMLLLK